MQQNHLSIIIPTLNRPDMLRQTIRSLHNCLTEDIAEVIVKDNFDSLI